MPPKARGRPAKKKRNISGLRNQPGSDNLLAPILESAAQDKNDPCEDNDRSPQDMKDMASSEKEDDLDSEEMLSCKIKDDQDDMDWIPYRLRREKGKKKDRPTTYKKGPDVMNKSSRTQRRYATSFKDQTRLDSYFGAGPSGSSVPQARRVSDRSTSSVETEVESVEIIEETHIILDSDEDDRGNSAGPSIPESEVAAGIPEKETNDIRSEEEISDEDQETSHSPTTEEMESSQL